MTAPRVALRQSSDTLSDLEREYEASQRQTSSNTLTDLEREFEAARTPPRPAHPVRDPGGGVDFRDATPIRMPPVAVRPSPMLGVRDPAAAPASRVPLVATRRPIAVPTMAARDASQVGAPANPQARKLTGGAKLASDVFSAAASTFEHPIETSVGIVVPPFEVAAKTGLYLGEKGNELVQQAEDEDRRRLGQPPRDVTQPTANELLAASGVPLVSDREAALSAAQLAAMGLGPLAGRVVGKGVAAGLGKVGASDVVARGVGGTVGAATAGGSIGAAFDPEYPARGGTLGALLGVAGNEVAGAARRRAVGPAAQGVEIPVERQIGRRKKPTTATMRTTEEPVPVAEPDYVVEHAEGRDPYADLTKPHAPKPVGERPRAPTPPPVRAQGKTPQELVPLDAPQLADVERTLAELTALRAPATDPDMLGELGSRINMLEMTGRKLRGEPEPEVAGAEGARRAKAAGVRSVADIPATPTATSATTQPAQPTAAPAVPGATGGDTEPVTVSIRTPPDHRGVMGGYVEHVVEAKDATGKVIGSADYELGAENVWVGNLEVDPTHRRRGIATRMYDAIQAKHPDMEIGTGDLTPDGEKFRQAYDARRPARSPKPPAQAEAVPTPAGGAQIVRMNTADILPDPARFQYKGSGDVETGAGGELRGLTKFDEQLAGVVSVWRDPATGIVHPVNGHNRLALAQRLGHPSLNVQLLNAKTAKEARAQGAIANIAEGRGTALDAAQFFRSSGQSPEMLADRVSVQGPTMRDGMALAKLAPDLFAKVETGELSDAYGAAIGDVLTDPAQQRAAVSAVQGSGKRLSAGEVRDVARQVRDAGSEPVTESSLFGTQTTEAPLYVEKAQLAGLVKRRLAQDKRLFGFVGKEGRAEQLARGGNVIDQAASRRIADESAQLEEVFTSLYTRSGPIADALTTAARQVKHGQSPANLVESLYPAIREAVRAAVGGGAGARGGAPEARGGIGQPAPEGGATPPSAPDDAPVADSQDPEQSGIFERGGHYGPDLFGNTEPTPADQGALFGETAGTAGSRSLAQTESAARSELDKLNQKQAALAPGRRLMPPEAARKAELEKLVNRGEKISHDELASRRDAAGPGTLLEPSAKYGANDSAPLAGTKVVDAQGQPKRVYHGTSAVYDAADMSKLDPNALYGPGLYFTENPSVAGGDGDATKGYHAKPSVLDQQKMAEWRRRMAALRTEKAHVMGQNPTRAVEIEFEIATLRSEGEALTREGAPNVRPARLAIKHPFDADAILDDPNGADERALFQAAEKLYPDHDWDYARDRLDQLAEHQNPDGGAFYNILSTTQDETGVRLGKRGATEILKAAGYDGITHTGGGRKSPHRVWIAFNPSQVRSAFGPAESAGQVMEGGTHYDAPSPEQLAMFARAQANPRSAGAMRARADDAKTAFGSVAARDTAIAKHAETFAELERSKIPTVDERIQQLAKHEAGRPARESINLRGVKLSGSETVAKVMDLVGRDATIEKMNVFHSTEDGDRVLHTQDTVGALNFINLPDSWLDQVADDAARNGTTVVDFGHNHPSGEAISSKHADVPWTVHATEYLAKRGITVRSHVVIDHHEYALIEPDGRATDRIPFPAAPAAYETPVEAGRRPITTYRDAAAALAEATAPDATMVLVVDAAHRIVAGSPRSARDLDTIDHWLPDLLTATGGKAVIIGAPGAHAARLAQKANATMLGAWEYGTPMTSPPDGWGRDILDIFAIFPPRHGGIRSLHDGGVFHASVQPYRSADAARTTATPERLLPTGLAGGVRPEPALRPEAAERVPEGRRVAPSPSVGPTTGAQDSSPTPQGEAMNETPYQRALRTRHEQAAAQRAEGGSLDDYDEAAQREWLRGATPPAKGQPIAIFRASKTGAPPKPGDYVTTSRSYAELHRRANLGGEGTIHQGLAHLDELFPADGPGEFWYLPRSLDKPPPAEGHRVAEPPAPYGPTAPPPDVAAAFNAAGADIDFSGKLAKDAKRRQGLSLSSRLDKFADAIANSNGPIERLGDLADASPNRNPRDLLTYVKASDATARRAFTEGVLDPITREVVGPSFASIFAPLKHDDAAIRMALTYVKAKRDVGRGIGSVRGNSEQWDNAQKIVAFGDEDPALSAFAQRWQAFTDAIGQYAVKSGLWTAELWNALQDSDVLYVRYKRILDPGVPQRSGKRVGSRLGNIGPGVDRFVGSERAIENPAQALAEYAKQIIHRADRYRVGAAVMGAIDDLGPVGELIGTRIPNPSSVSKAIGAQRGKQLPLAPAEVVAEVRDLFAPQMAKDNPVLWRNAPGGGKEYMQIHAPDLWAALMQLNAQDEGAVRAFLDVTIRPLKRVFTATTTGWSPRFSLATNPARDIPDALAKSQAGLRPDDIVKGYAHSIASIVKASSPAEEASRAGLADVSIFAQDRPELAAREAAPLSRADRVRNRVGRVGGAPLSAIERVGAASDMGPRLGEYMAAMRRNMNKVESGEWTIEEARLRAATLGRNVTLDFTNRPGNPVLKLFADYVPFFGVGLQGPTQYALAWKRNPRRMAAAAAIVATAAVVAWLIKRRLDDDEREAFNDRSATERSGSVMIPTSGGEGPTLKIPLGQENGIIFQGVTAALDKAFDDDPNAGALFLASLERALPSGLDAASQGIIPIPGVQQIQENARNEKVFGGRPVESRRLQSLPVEDRRYDTTSPTFDFVAAGARSLGASSVSPLKAENIVRGMTSNATPLITAAFDPLAERLMGRNAKPSLGRGALHSPLNPASAFLASTVPSSTQSEEAYYAMKERHTRAVGALRAADTAGNDADAERILTRYKDVLNDAVEGVLADTDEAIRDAREEESDIRQQYQSGAMTKATAREGMDAIARARQKVVREAMLRLRRRRP